MRYLRPLHGQRSGPRRRVVRLLIGARSGARLAPRYAPRKTWVAHALSKLSFATHVRKNINSIRCSGAYHRPTPCDQSANCPIISILSNAEVLPRDPTCRKHFSGEFPDPRTASAGSGMSLLVTGAVYSFWFTGAVYSLGKWRYR